VPNPSGALKPGLFARARVRLGRSEQLVAVPETAVANLAGVIRVFVLEDGQARERKVHIVRKRGSDALLAGELKAGEQVILTGIARLHDGAPVQRDGEAPRSAGAAE